jgi:hypothetical protein
LKLSLRLTSTCRVSRSRMDSPACAFVSILPVPSEPFLKPKLAPLPLARFFRTCLPVPDLLCLACTLHA